MKDEVKEFKRHYCSTSTHKIDNLEFKIVTCGDTDYFYLNRLNETGNHQVCEKYFFEKYNQECSNFYQQFVKVN